MGSTGDTAPNLVATYRGRDHEAFELDGHLGDGPTVLAFFPGRTPTLFERDGGPTGAVR